MKKFEVDTWCLLGAVLKKWWLIALVALVCGTGVLLGSILLTSDAYTAEVLFCVGTGAENATVQTVTAARNLTDSCAVLLRTRSCLEAVSAAAGRPVTAAMVTGEAVEGTEFLRVTVRSESSQTAVAIAAAVEQILPQLADTYLSGGTLQVVDSAGAGTREQADHLSRGLCGFGLGALAAAAALCIPAIKKEREASL